MDESEVSAVRKIFTVRFRINAQIDADFTLFAFLPAFRPFLKIQLQYLKSCTQTYNFRPFLRYI